MAVKYLVHRFLFNNFLRPSRLPYYDSVIKSLATGGYKFYTLENLNREMINNTFPLIQKNNKICVIRHDIDTDPKTATELAKIEAKYGAVSTYYYRLRTAVKKQMKIVADLGHEVGYHYEEIGKYAKKKNLHSKDEIDNHMDNIQSDFLNNLHQFRNLSNCPVSTIASHGDWVNAHFLKIPNKYLIDTSVRISGKIELEAYDENFMQHVSCRISDLGGENIWYPIKLEDALKSDPKFLYILIHPRQWYTRSWENIKEDTLRLFETIMYKFNI